jgi:hypothetical protein
MAERIENRALAPAGAILHEASSSASQGTLAVTHEAVRGRQEWVDSGHYRSAGSLTGDRVLEAAHPANARLRSRRFLIALALVTLVPLVGVPLSSLVMSAFGGGLMPGTFALLSITGPMHVASTSFFYFDRDFWPVIRESPMRCLWSLGWLPLTLLAFGVVGTAMLGPWAGLILFSFHNTWLFYHYQRQNFGLISFVSTHVGCGRLPPRVNTALNVAALGAIICMLGTPNFFPNPGGLVTANASFVMRTAGTVVYALSICLMIWAFRSEPRLRQSALVIGGLILGLGFFLPAIVFPMAGLGFMPYAIAHGAQYILMMSVLSGRSSRGWLAFLTMCALGATLGFAMDSMRSWWAMTVSIAFVEVHFLIDAKVWRLREPPQRAIINRRFDFLLAT